jgi:hypothetical protein
MPVVKPDEFDWSSVPDSRGFPLVWAEQRMMPVRLDTSDAVLELAFGEGKSRKLKSWGHAGEHNAHWLVTRGGTPMHTDPAYARYTHHLILRNDGFRLRGAEDRPDAMPLKVGAMYCLDAHSPHQVVPDPRLTFLGKPVYKVQAAVDTDEPLEPDEVWAILGELIIPGDLTVGAAEAAKTAPAPRPK